MVQFAQTAIPDVIKKNPFRILGCLSNSPAKDILSNKNKLKAFVRIGRQCSFPAEFSNLFGDIQRTPSDITEAEQSLDLPEDLIRYALFYFCKVSPLDDAALSQLQAGNTARAIEIWKKRYSFSSYINLSILFTCQKDFYTAINFISLLIHDKHECGNFLSMLNLNANQYNESDLIRIYIEALSHFTSWKIIYYAILKTGNKEDITYVENEAISPSIKRIENVISSKDNDISGTTILNDTHEDLAFIDELLRQNNIKRILIHDKLAKKLCHIALNTSKKASTDEQIQKNCLLWIQKATEIAEGENTVSDCKYYEEIVNNKLKTSKIVKFIDRMNDAEKNLTDKKIPTLYDVSIYIRAIEIAHTGMNSACDDQEIITNSISNFCIIAYNTIVSILDDEHTKNSSNYKNTIIDALSLIERVLLLPLNDEAIDHFENLENSLIETKEILICNEIVKEAIDARTYLENKTIPTIQDVLIYVTAIERMQQEIIPIYDSNEITNIVSNLCFTAYNTIVNILNNEQKSYTGITGGTLIYSVNSAQTVIDRILKLRLNTDSRRHFEDLKNSIIKLHSDIITFSDKVTKQQKEEGCLIWLIWFRLTPFLLLILYILYSILKH